MAAMVEMIGFEGGDGVSMWQEYLEGGVLPPLVLKLH
jgi:hypothetical protein